jgi:hypothetical protein
VHAGWADKLARTLGVSLASVAPSVWHAASGRAAAQAHGAEGTVIPGLELAQAAQKAVALAQQGRDIRLLAGNTRRLIVQGPPLLASTCSSPVPSLFRQTLISTTRRREPISTETPAQRHLRRMWLNPDRRGGGGSLSHHSPKPGPLLTWRSRSCWGHGLACAGGRSQEACAASYSFITAAGMRPRSLICLPCSLAHARTAAVSTRWFRDPRC